jgi:medium-chain acyl-[acyl-carrier-protein] hydrolase
MIPSRFKTSYQLNAFHCTFTRKLGLPPLLTILQDAASQHAAMLGWGYEEMIKSGHFWVLSRQRLQMSYWPSLKEEIEVLTWVRNEATVASIRDFKIFHRGESIGSATSTWVTLHAQTRRPVIVERGHILKQLDHISGLSYTAEKIPVPLEASQVGEVIVKLSDIDHNMHVNNTRYAQWIIDVLPFSWHQHQALQDYHVNFLNEARLGDKILLYRHDLIFYGVREADGKSIFIARLNHNI